MSTPNLPPGSQGMYTSNPNVLSQFAASSSYNSKSTPGYARLDNSEGWIAAYGQANPWIYLEHNVVAEFVGVKTQGHPGGSLFTKSYTIEYSLDGNTWKSYQNGAVQTGNADCQNTVTNVFPKSFRAKFIRLSPKTWSYDNQYGPGLRLDAFWKALPPMSPALSIDFGSDCLKDRCGGVLQNGSGFREIEWRVDFKSLFTAVPWVSTTIKHLETKNNAADVTVSVLAKDIDEEGFTLYFKTWSGCNVVDCKIDWIAIQK
eukprot:gene2648-3054_t